MKAEFSGQPFGMLKGRIVQEFWVLGALSPGVREERNRLLHRLHMCHITCRVWLFKTLESVAHQAPLSMGMLQARILKWVAMPFSSGSSWPRYRTPISCVSFTGRRVLYHQRQLGRPLHRLLLLSRFSRVRLCVTPQTAAHQAPLSTGFSR